MGEGADASSATLLLDPGPGRRDIDLPRFVAGRRGREWRLLCEAAPSSADARGQQARECSTAVGAVGAPYRTPGVGSEAPPRPHACRLKPGEPLASRGTF